MKTLTSKLAVAGCAICPAKGPLAGQDVYVNAPVHIPSRRMPSTTNNVGEVVLTTAGHGSFLVRPRKTSAAIRCPLMDYEVRRIDGPGPSIQTPDRPADTPANRRTARTACQELLKLALERRI